MRLFWLVNLMFFLFSCTKDTLNGSYNNSTRDEYSSKWAEVVGIDSSCNEIATKVKIMSNFDADKYDGFFSSTTFWTFNLPDSLKAVGQPMDVNFTPVKWALWKECSNKNFQDQIEVKSAHPITTFSYFEVIEVNPGCSNQVLVKVLPSYMDTRVENAYCINLPDSSKIVGNRLRGWYRRAGIYERIKCNNLQPISQVIIHNPTQW